MRAQGQPKPHLQLNPRQPVANWQMTTKYATGSIVVNAPVGHAALAISAWFASRQHTQPSPAPYGSQPGTDIFALPKLEKGKRRTTQPEQA